MINSNIETRQRRNSQFDNQLEEFNTESEFNAVPELGAIIWAQGDTYVGDGTEWQRLAKANEIPTFSNGYQVAYDDRHASYASAQILTNVEQEVENNVATSFGNLGIYDGTKFYFQNRTIYTVSISFTAQMSTNNAHANLFFGYSGIPYNGDANILYFAKGKDVDHYFTMTYQIVGDDSTANGIKLYIHPSHGGRLWNAKFTIQQAF